MLSIYFIFVSAYLLLYFFGYPIKVLLLDKKYKHFDLYITPWFGLGLIILVLMIFSWNGYSVNEVSSSFFLLTLAINVLIYFKYREFVCSQKNEFAIISIIGLLLASLYGIMLNFGGRGLYALLAGNNDFASYLCVVKTVQSNSAQYIANNPIGVAHLNATLTSMYAQLRGCSFFIAYYATLFDMDIIHVQFVLMAFVMFLNTAALRLFLKRELTLTSCFLMLLACFNSFQHWLVWYGFLGQLFSIGFVIIALFLTNSLVNSDAFDLKLCLLGVFLLTCITYNYIESTGYPIVPVIIFAFFIFIGKKYEKKLFLMNVCLVALLYSLINYDLLFKFFDVARHTSSHDAGWAMPLATLTDMIGLPSFSYNKIVLCFLNALILFILALQAKKKGLSSFLSASLFTYFLVYAIICFLYFSPGKISSYKAYKAAASFSFIVTIFLNMFWERNVSFGMFSYNGVSPSRVILSNPKKNVFSAWIVLFCFCIWGVGNIYEVFSKYLQPLFEHPRFVITKAHDVLQPFAENSLENTADFFLNVQPPIGRIDTMVAEYFAPIGRGYVNSHVSYQPHSMKKGFKAGDFYITGTEMPPLYGINAPLLFSNEIYSVFKLQESSIFLYDYAGLSHVLEKGIFLPEKSMFVPTLRRISSPDVRFQFISLTDLIDQFHVALFFDKRMKTSYDAYVNGEFITSITADEECEFLISQIDIKFKAGVNEIVLKFSGDVSTIRLGNIHFSDYDENQINGRNFKRISILHDNKIMFGIGGNADSYIISGFAEPAQGYRWTVGAFSSIAFEYSGSIRNFSCRISPFVFGSHKIQHVDVWVNGIKVDEWELTKPSQRVVHLPLSLQSSGRYILSFSLRDAVTPFELGVNTDSRRLALGVHEISIDSICD